MPKKLPQDSTERFSKITAIVSVFFIALVGVLAITYSFAAPKNGKGGGQGGNDNSVNMYLSPSSQRVSVGEVFSAAVWVDVGPSIVNAVQANVNFDSSKLQFVSVDPSSSSYDVEAQGVLEGDVVKIARGSFSGVTGSTYVASVNFKAIDKVRKTNIAFTDGSAVIDSGTILDILEKTTKSQISIR